MATDLATLRVNVVAATDDFKRGMGDVRKETKKTSEGLAFMRTKLLAVTAAATGVGFLAKKTFEVGAAVEETASKYRTVFGPAVEETNKLMGRQARVMGMTDQQMQELVATTGAIAQGMGLAQRESATFSTAVTKLAADFASFNNVPIEETSRAIQSALTGERESLKRLGVVVQETDVQKRALIQTGKENAKQLTQQEKAYATLALITEKAGVAVGDLDRTQDSAANTARHVAATFRQFADDIAVGLLPAMTVILGTMEDGSEGLAQWGREFKKNGRVIAAWAEVAVLSIKAVWIGFRNLAVSLGLIGLTIGTVIKENWTMSLTEFHALVGEVSSEIGALMGEYGQAFRDVGEAIKGLETAGEGLQGGLFGKGGLTLDLELLDVKLNEVERTVRSVATALTDSLADAIMGSKDALMDFVNLALRELTKLAIKFAIFKGLTAAATGGSSLAADLLKITGLNFGGAVDGALAHGGPARAGGTYLVGEKGPELFTPQQSGYVHPNGGAGLTLNVNMSAPSNPIAMARDAEWQRAFRESAMEAMAGGFSFQGA